LTTIADSLMPEFDREMSTTRRLLERVPDDKFAWKPHAKSMSFGDLATHLANLPGWGATAITQSEFNLAGGTMAPATSRTDVLARFDKNVADTRAALTGRSDSELMAVWTLRHGDQKLFSMPKAAVWRAFMMNHLIHHRGQLSVYLRLNDVPVPAMYGPSADEAPNF
jgi:uncharacterized damage-inducible protein DinB